MCMTSKMNLDLTSFSFLATFFLFLSIAFKIWKKERPSENLPPGPWRLPFVGNIHQLATDQPHRRLTELAKTYGPIMQLQIGQVSAVIISSSESAKQVLKTQESYFIDRPFILAMDIMLYNSKSITFAPFGEYWRELRKIIILDVLSAKRVKSFRLIRTKEVLNFIERLQLKGQPDAVNFTTEIYSLVNSIIAVTATGKKNKKQEEMIAVIPNAVVAVGGFSVVDAYPSFKFLPWITGMSSLVGRIHRQYDEILDDIINEHRAIRAADKSKKEADNIVDVLLDVLENGDLPFTLTTDDVKAMITDLVGAATDTSAVIIEWTMSELIKNPCVMKKAQEEVRRVCKGKKTIDEEDLRELKYLKMIIKETFRLHPPKPLIPRECRHKCHLNGYVIYPKTKVLINPRAIGRDPMIWDDPESFYPERFLDISIDFKGNDFELIPFGAGKRICPGLAMAMANIELIVAQILYRFDWKLPVGVQSENLDMSESFGIVVKRKTNLILVPIPYDI